MKKISALKHKIFTKGGIFLVASILSNVFNFVFNAFMGRVLSVENFGLVTFINTLVLLLGIFMNAFGSSITHRVAFLSTNSSAQAAFTFVNKLRGKALFFGLGISFVWILLLPISSTFFKIDDLRILFFFTPVFTLFLYIVIFRGYLTGNLYFIEVSLALLIEGVTKVTFGVLFFLFDQTEYAYLAIPLSLSAACLFLFVMSRKVEKNITSNNKSYAFPRRFFVAAAITGLATSGFLSLDLILVKHYLLPKAAGEYALLSLAGKMIFFAGSLFNTFILTFVSRDIGHGRNPRRIFSKLILGTIIITFIAYVFIGILGARFMPLAFGAKVIPILPYLPLYSFAIACFTIGSAYTMYHLARHHFAFSALSLISSSAMIVGIYLFHKDINQITHVIFTIAVVNLIVILFLHELQKNGRFLLRNLIDLFDIFSPVPNQKSFDKHFQRILIFNWRDMKHKYAGGAEVYIHELAKRWVSAGNSVTVFCGNDGNAVRNEVIDGVQMVRRGGFYTVYLWAFLYYVLRFRGKYDVIIDTENGIPFFTPLYVRERIYCLMFHVHQEVFRKTLSKPLAIFASILENRLMPWAYRRTKFITISDSSKQEILDLDLGKAGIEIVYPGIDLKRYRPAPRKSKNPLIAYIGRLQMYKSVDVFIKTAKNVLKKAPHAEVVIAGDGEERRRLEELVEKLGLNDKVSFLGKISEDEKVRLYQKAWIAVNPSLKEGWGITSIEANACGTPVVASDVPGLRDSVNNPSTGFLVQYGNQREFSNKILTLIENSELRQKMGKNSLKWAQQFEWQKIAERSLNIIQ